jgi:hypothetical protein
MSDEILQGNLYWNLAGEESFFAYANLGEWAQATGKEMVEDQVIGINRETIGG